MQMNWKIIVPVVVVIVMIAALVGGRANRVSTSLVVDENVPTAALPTEEVLAPIVPTGGTVAVAPTNDDGMVAPASVITSASLPGAIDEFTASITLAAGTDAALLGDSDADIAMVAADSKSINDFTTAYDETTF